MSVSLSRPWVHPRWRGSGHRRDLGVYWSDRISKCLCVLRISQCLRLPFFSVPMFDNQSFLYGSFHVRCVPVLVPSL